MRFIRRKRNRYSLLFTGSALLTLVSCVKSRVGATLVCAALTIAALLLLIRQSRLLNIVDLIWTNRILVVPLTAIPTIEGAIKTDSEKTVVSTFGLWDGVKIHEWGQGGMLGVRLTSMDIRKDRVNLTFGNAGETTWAELMHGITNLDEVLDVQEKLWRETGVIATIVDW
ncbi:MAG: hypothetical protein GX956_04775 [Firmicutes bacterium]|nr:hypothetical protein [Bacillota bacterium]